MQQYTQWVGSNKDRYNRKRRKMVTIEDKGVWEEEEDF